ncbi:MAG: T9SS type A sorting domain-containing protein [Flavobacteriales bacterium]
MKLKLLLPLILLTNLYSTAQINSAKVYWVGHSLISHTYTKNPSSVNLMSLMDTMATSQTKTYDFYDHTTPGAPIGWNWGHAASSWTSGTQSLIQPLITTTHPDYGTFDVIVVTEGIDINNTYYYWASSFYARKFYNAAKRANPNTRLFLYESWHHYNASDPTFRPEYGPISTFNWDTYMANARNTWDSIAIRASNPALTQNDAGYSYQGTGTDPGLGSNILDIKIIPTGTVFREVLKRLDSNLASDNWSFKSGTLKDVDFFQNPLANFPADTVTKVHPADPLDDIHPSDLLVYLNSLVHYAVIYQDNPINLPAANGVPTNIAAIFKEVVWKVVTNDPKTGVNNTSSIKEKQRVLVTVLPNPVTNFLTVKFDKHVEQTSVSIINMLGQKVIEINNISGTSQQLELNNIPNGMYQVVIQSGENHIMKKIVKQ